jgi:hypothetical protein
MLHSAESIFFCFDTVNTNFQFYFTAMAKKNHLWPFFAMLLFYQLLKKKKHLWFNFTLHQKTPRYAAQRGVSCNQFCHDSPLYSTARSFLQPFLP